MAQGKGFSGYGNSWMGESLYKDIGNRWVHFAIGLWKEESCCFSWTQRKKVIPVMNLFFFRIGLAIAWSVLYCKCLTCMKYFLHLCIIFLYVLSSAALAISTLLAYHIEHLHQQLFPSWQLRVPPDQLECHEVLNLQIQRSLPSVYYVLEAYYIVPFMSSS